MRARTRSHSFVFQVFFVVLICRMAVRKRTLFAFGAHFSTPDSAGLHPGYNYKRCALDSPNETYVFFAPFVVDILFILVAALPSVERLNG